MRAGRTEKAGSLARRIGIAIIRKNTAPTAWRRLNQWTEGHVAKVRELINPRAREALAPQGISAQVLKRPLCSHFHRPNLPTAYTQVNLQHATELHWWNASLPHPGPFTPYGHRPWWTSCLVSTPWCPSLCNTHSWAIQSVTQHIHSPSAVENSHHNTHRQSPLTPHCPLTTGRYPLHQSSLE